MPGSIYMLGPGDLRRHANVQRHIHLQTDDDMRGAADLPWYSVV